MKKDLTQGCEWRGILAFALPIMAANLLQVLYNFADSVIVGNFIGPTALGAVGLTGSMTWLLNAFCSALGAGTTIAVAQYFGAKKHKEITDVATAAYIISFILASVLTAVCFIVAKPVIVGFLQAPAEMQSDSIRYFIIFGCGVIFQLLYNVTYGILRAHGDSRGALIFLLVSAFINIALDILFIVTFHWGVAGAAMATIISQAGAAMASMVYMHVRLPELTLGRENLSAFKAQSKMLTGLSVPIVLQTTVTSLGFILLQRLINSFGTASIEGYSAMLKIEQFAHIPSQSFNVAISAFAGQNIGAGKTDRARRGYRSTVIMGVCISVVISAVVIGLDTQLLSMFNISGESLLRGREHLDLLMCFIWVNTIMNITCGFLQGAGDVRLPAASSFINLGIRLALSFALAATSVGFRCYYVSMPPAWIIACMVVVVRYRGGKWKNYSLVKQN